MVSLADVWEVRPFVSRSLPFQLPTHLAHMPTAPKHQPLPLFDVDDHGRAVARKQVLNAVPGELMLPDDAGPVDPDAATDDDAVDLDSDDPIGGSSLRRRRIARLSGTGGTDGSSVMTASRRPRRRAKKAVVGSASAASMMARSQVGVSSVGMSPLDTYYSLDSSSRMGVAPSEFDSPDAAEDWVSPSQPPRDVALYMAKQVRPVDATAALHFALM